MASETPRDITEILSDPNVVVEALREAVKDAIQRHKQMGLPMVVSKDGAVHWITPEEAEREMEDSSRLPGE